MADATTKLKTSSLKWAIKHISYECDTDRFPRPFEIDAVNKCKDRILEELSTVDISSHGWSEYRKMLMLKEEVSFRSVIQLDPLDAILFAATIREIGSQLEKARRPATEQTIYSHRFGPDDNGKMYSTDNWNGFWERSIQLANSPTCRFVAIADISDFYNQAPHHTIENELTSAGVRSEFIKGIMNLLKETSDTVSRGVPVGPHASHLLAEISLVPIDNLITSIGRPWARYVDDFHIFCAHRSEAQASLFQLASHLNEPHRLVLNPSKTRILARDEFLAVARTRLKNTPINDFEKAIIDITTAYSNNPYGKITLDKLSDEERARAGKNEVEQVLTAYLAQDPRDYVGIRYFLRRLTQLGAPGAIDFLVTRLEDLLPALAEILEYFISAAPNYKGEWEDIGDKVLRLLDLEIAKTSNYVQMALLGLFAGISQLDHIDSILRKYHSAHIESRREITLAAANAGARDWITSQRSSLSTLDPWSRRALLYAARILQQDERQSWLKSKRKNARNSLEQAVIDLAF